MHAHVIGTSHCALTGHSSPLPWIIIHASTTNSLPPIPWYYLKEDDSIKVFALFQPPLLVTWCLLPHVVCWYMKCVWIISWISDTPPCSISINSSNPYKYMINSWWQHRLSAFCLQPIQLFMGKTTITSETMVTATWGCTLQHKISCRSLSLNNWVSRKWMEA